MPSRERIIEVLTDRGQFTHPPVSLDARKVWAGRMADLMRDTEAERAKEVLLSWLNQDGFQEGADGATQVIDVFLGEGTGRQWFDEWMGQRSQ